MAKITPFKALRPQPNAAEQVAALPYDVCSVAEAKQYKDNPHHFYHVTRSEIDLPDNTDVHSDAVYQKAAENLNAMIANNIMLREEKNCYYIYRLNMNGRNQTGLLCGSSLEDYNNGIIKKHEFTRPEKELDRINHIYTTKAQTGVVFLAYRDVNAMNEIIENWKNNHQATYDFTTEDDVQHTVWVVNDDNTIKAITNLFDTQVPATYIADGHHRAASAEKVMAKIDAEGSSTSDAHHYFLTCIFPESQLAILDYNRVVKDLNGLSNDEFLTALQNDFEVKEIGSEIVKPSQPKEFGLFLNNTWYQLNAKEGTYETDPISVLDVSILQNNILSKILNINDPRVDKRVDFVGGIRGLKELEKRVAQGEAAAFSCYPVSLSQLFEVADSGKVMPPKSTWFEPKTRDGLIVYML